MQRQDGFTLVELMVTLAIFAILMVLAVPSFNSQIQNNRSQAIGEDLTTALKYARSEAVKRGQSVTICASNANNSGCSNDTSTWSNGWLVLLDAAAPTSSSINPGEILRVWGDVPSNAQISVVTTPNTSSTGTAISFIRYASTGTLARISNNVHLKRITAFTSGCNLNGRQELIIGVAGMVNVTRSDCPSGS
ncbi:Fimbrial protein [Thalassocella blandensis]|nr:Fimbrial protein [Thalassocella blandensis]